jgi:hypothetical protein
MDYAARTYAALLVYPDSCTHDGILPYFHAVANVGIGIDEDASAEFHAPAYVSERPDIYTFRNIHAFSYERGVLDSRRTGL